MTSDASERASGRGGGLFDSLKTMMATLIAIVQTRVELLSTELEEERIRLTSMLVWGFVTLFCAALGVIFLTLLLVIALWDDHRLLAVGIPAGVFFTAALLSWLALSARARAKPKLFSASLAELKRDRAQLREDHE